MLIPGAFDRMQYDPDIQFSLLFDVQQEEAERLAQQERDRLNNAPKLFNDQVLRDPNVTTGIIIGVILFLLLVGAIAVFIRVRQVRKINAERAAARDRIQSGLSNPEGTGRTQSFEPPADSSKRSRASSKTKRDSNWQAGSSQRASLTNT